MVVVLTRLGTEPTHIFYKKLLIDENNIFTANLAEKNEVKEIRFKKSKEYAISVLSIKQDVDSDLVAVTDTDRQEVISNLIQKLINEKKEPDLDLRIYNEEAFEIIVPFKKKASCEVPPIKYTFYNGTTKKKKKLNFTTTWSTWKNLGLSGKTLASNLNILLSFQPIKKGIKNSLKI